MNKLILSILIIFFLAGCDLEKSDEVVVADEVGPHWYPSLPKKTSEIWDVTEPMFMTGSENKSKVTIGKMN